MSHAHKIDRILRIPANLTGEWVISRNLIWKHVDVRSRGKSLHMWHTAMRTEGYPKFEIGSCAGGHMHNYKQEYISTALQNWAAIVQLQMYSYLCLAGRGQCTTGVQISLTLTGLPTYFNIAGSDVLSLGILRFSRLNVRRPRQMWDYKLVASKGACETCAHTAEILM